MMDDSWFPKPPETEMRRITAETFYETEIKARRQGYLEDPALVFRASGEVRQNRA